MTTTSSGFDAVDTSSEHYSLQRFLAGMFPDTEIRRRFVEGVFVERPFMIITMVSHSVARHNTYVAYSITDFVISYYANSFSDAQNALDKLSSLAWKYNRIPSWDYSDVKSPSATVDHMRIQDASCQLILDLDDHELHNVMCNLTLEGKRSYSKFVNQTVIDSVEIGVV